MPVTWKPANNKVAETWNLASKDGMWPAPNGKQINGKVAKPAYGPWKLDELDSFF